MNPTARELNLSTPATYRIQVQGQLDEGWSPRLGGMTVRTATAQDWGSVTTLEGVLLDQAALQGVLDTLFMLNLRLLFVDCRPPDVG